MENGKIWIYPIIFRPFEKSSSVKLLKGFLSKNPGQVIAERCRFCHRKPELLAINFRNANCRLYGCKTEMEKCKKVLIKVEIGKEAN